MRTVTMKDGSIVNIDSAIENSDYFIKDADGAFFFARELEYIKAKSYDVKYAALKARQLFPVSSEAGPGAQTITYQTYDQVGSAQIIMAYANDLPRADVAGKETLIPVRSIGSSFGYNINEINAAKMVGKPLDQRRANAVRRAAEETINRVAFFGDAASGLPGFFTNSNIPTGAVAATGTGSTTTFSTKTPDQILFDINDLFADVFETTKMVHQATKLCLPPSQYSYIMSTPRATNSDTTIAQFLVNNSPYLSSLDDIIPLNECVAANNSSYSVDVMFVYNPDPDNLQLEIPLELEFLPVQHTNLEFLIPAHGRLAGLNIYYPLSIAIGSGI